MAAQPAWEFLLAERSLLARVVALARNSIPLLHVSRRLRSAILDADLGERVLRSDDPDEEIDAAHCLSLIALAARTRAMVHVEHEGPPLMVAGWQADRLPAKVRTAFSAAQLRTCVDLDVTERYTEDLAALLPSWLGRPRRLNFDGVTPELRALLSRALAASAPVALESVDLLTEDAELLAACRTARSVSIHGGVEYPASSIDSKLANALSCCASMTELQLYKFGRADSAAIQSVACTLAGLAGPLRLTLGRVPGSAFGLFRERALCARLERLSIACGRGTPPDDASLEAVCRALALDAKNLRGLTLATSPADSPTFGMLNATGVLDLPRLSELELNLWHAAFADVTEGIRKLKRLSALRLDWHGDPQGAAELVGALAHDIAESRTLQELVVLCRHRARVSGSAAAALCRALPASIRTLWLGPVDREHFLREDELVEVLQRLPRLRMFDVQTSLANAHQTAQEEDLIRRLQNEIPRIESLSVVLPPE